MNQFHIISLVAAAATLGFAVAWYIVGVRSREKYSMTLMNQREKLTALVEADKARSARLSDLTAQHQRARAEITALQNRLLTISDERSTAIGRLDQLEHLQKELAVHRNRIQQLQAVNESLRNGLTRHKTLMERERAAAEEKMALLETAEKRLSDTYRALSVRALRENNRIFMDLAGSTLSRYLDSAKSEMAVRGDAVKEMVAPIVDALEKYDHRVQDLEQARQTAYGSLSQQLETLVRTQNALQKEAGNLAKALRVPHVRGRWGEITLRRVAELAGMQNRCDFIEQPSLDSPDSRMRPDMMVYLPENRRIAVDAKVPLEAYLEALEAKTDTGREKLLSAHARQVHAHIKQLARKAYWSQFTPTPEFVILFIPGENFFSAALAQQPELIEQSAAENVMLATPTTMITLLKTIAFAWRQQTAAHNVEEIRNLGKTLYKRLATLVGHMNALGRDLERSQQSYNKAVGAFENRIFATARKFETLGIADAEDSRIEPIDSLQPAIRKCSTET